MDANTLLIVNKIQKNESIEFKDFVLYLIILPIITLILSKFSVVYTKIYDYCHLKYKQWNDFNEVIIEGYEAIDQSGLKYDYPLVLTAFIWKLNTHYKCKMDLRAYDGKWIRDPSSAKKESFTEFSVNTTRSNWIHLEKDISFHVTRFSGDPEKETVYYYSKRIVTLTLRSRKIDLKSYLNKILIEHEMFIAQKNQGKLYHFLYTGTKEGAPTFITKCFSDLNTDPNTETFVHLANEHCERLMNDLKRLKDIDYHARTGTSRKKGYLFWGVPGTGKSTTVLAMANYDNRHILEIPMSRITANEEFEKLIGIEMINGIKIRSDQIIYLFEEIDTSDVSHKRKSDDSSKEDSDSDTDDTSNTDKCDEILKDGKNKNNKKAEKRKIEDKERLEIVKKEIKKRDQFFDTLNLGVILARLDGIGNYNGTVIVATTNHKEKLDPALYRDQRLTPIEFSYSRRVDMIKLSERYYETKLTSHQKMMFPDRDAKITPARFRTLLETNESVTELLLNLTKT
jgi:hypothetical protein